MTSTDTLLPCPFCGEDLIPDATPDGLAEHPSSDCPAGDWLVRPADWNRRTPPTPATDEREAVARALCIAGEEDDFNYKGYLELADAALSTLAQIRAAEILAAEARGMGRARTVVQNTRDGMKFDPSATLEWRNAITGGFNAADLALRHELDATEDFDD